MWTFPAPAVAVLAYINIPSIAGENPTPGYPGAIAVSSVTITPEQVSITKTTDSASASLFLAVANGTLLGTTNLLLYNTAPVGAPDATLDFFNTLATAYQSVGGDTEEVSFNANNPVELFLEVPGIPGESNTPGYSNILQIESITLTNNEFTIIKLSDSATDDLFLANATGEFFPVVRLLLYDSLPLDGPPDATIEFQDLLISASQVLVDPVQPRDQHSFNFQTLSPSIPEPATTYALVLAATAMIARRSRRFLPD